MIHYNQIEKKFRARKEGQEVVLKITGMVSPGRYRAGHEKEGEVIPPKPANDTLVRVTEVGVDYVKVEDPDGNKFTFCHLVGASRLLETKLTSGKEAAKQAEKAESDREPAKGTELI